MIENILGTIVSWGVLGFVVCMFLLITLALYAMTR